MNWQNIEYLNTGNRKQQNIYRIIIEDFEFEIYASPLPVEKQNAYRHLSIMKRLIDIGGKNFCDKIRHLKINGLKTEPAIAKLLNLDGNPYNAVLSLEYKKEEELEKLMRNRT